MAKTTSASAWTDVGTPVIPLATTPAPASLSGGLYMAGLLKRTAKQGRIPYNGGKIRERRTAVPMVSKAGTKGPMQSRFFREIHLQRPVPFVLFL